MARGWGGGIYQNQLWDSGNQYLLIPSTPTSAPPGIPVLPSPWHTLWEHGPSWRLYCQEPLFWHQWSTIGGWGREVSESSRGQLGRTISSFWETPEENLFPVFNQGCIYPKNCYVLILQIISLKAVRVPSWCWLSSGRGLTHLQQRLFDLAPLLLCSGPKFIQCSDCERGLNFVKNFEL